MRKSLSKDARVAHDENGHDEHRDAVFDPRFCPGGEFHTFALVGFSKEVIPAPAEFLRAEQHEDKSAQRQHIVRDDEVLDALNIAD